MVSLLSTGDRDHVRERKGNPNEAPKRLYKATWSRELASNDLIVHSWRKTEGPEECQALILGVRCCRLETLHSMLQASSPQPLQQQNELLGMQVHQESIRNNGEKVHSGVLALQKRTNK